MSASSNHCIVWSHLYSYSFDANPNWTREYPGQEEIHAYLVGVAERWGLYRHIRFNTAVDEARWNESEKKWKVALKVCGQKEAEFGMQYTLSSEYLVSGVGQLNLPHYPEIEGIDNFGGKIMHSARWDWSFNLEGKKIGIIGNGATSAQIIPEVAKVCDNLTVFQRTPNWIVPRDDAPISDAMRTIYQYVPGARKAYRASLMVKRESFFDVAVVDDSDANIQLRKDTLEKMKRELSQKPELWEKLIPDYPPGCKRVILSDDFFPTLNRSNVDLETRHIERITPRGVAVDGKEYECDLIILATGFRTLEFMYPIKIYGEGGRSIEDIWKKGARAYLGITVESLPNFGMLYGPNTNLGHNSIILMIEAQSNYITAMIGAVLKAKRQGKTLSILPKLDRINQYNIYLQERIKELTFSSSKCQSWYKNEEGLVTNNWCGTVIEYQNRLSNLDWADYEFSGCAAADLNSTNKLQRLGRVVEESSLSILSVGAMAAATVLALRLAASTSAVQNVLGMIRVK